MLRTFRSNPYVVACAGLCLAALAIAVGLQVGASSGGLGSLLLLIIALAAAAGIMAVFQAHNRERQALDLNQDAPETNLNEGEAVIPDKNTAVDGFLELSPFPAGVVNRTGAIIQLNHGAEELFGAGGGENSNTQSRQISDFLETDTPFWQAEAEAKPEDLAASVSARLRLQGDQLGREVLLLPTVGKTTQPDAEHILFAVIGRDIFEQFQQATTGGMSMPVAALPAQFFVIDQNLNIVDANEQAKHLFPDPASIRGGDILGLIAPEYHEEIRGRLEKSFAGEGVASTLDIELAGELADEFSHAPVMLDFPARATATSAGAVMPLQFVDRRAYRDLQDQFTQSQRMQAVGQLAGGVAHDFNNLLTAMIGHCDLLLQQARPGDPIFPDVMQVKQNANRAANLVRQLLAFSRQQTLRPKILLLTDLLADLGHLLHRLIGENIELKISHGRDLGLVRVDQGQFDQVIINLAVNARDAMPDGGILAISTANYQQAQAETIRNELMPAGDYVSIEISDTGVGMDDEVMERIFEPFYSTKDSAPGIGGSGSGLGLATVFGIIRQTGGFISTESELGVGTKFCIYLPQHELAPGEIADLTLEAVPVERQPDLTGKGKILVVEDETAVRMFACRALRNKGYSVHEAESGEHALSELEKIEGDIDLLITDVIMPQMDGPTLVGHVRERMPEIKVMMISGYAEESIRRNMDQDLDFMFLTKPFNLQELATAVKQVLSS